MAGNNPFQKKVVPQTTQDEIAKRAANRINWTGQRFPWIKVTSMSSGCADKYVVLSSTKGDLYESSAYQRPLPVITGVDVKKQGELGTTRRATVKLTAFTDAQLIELQKCYFIPGMSVRVEWGWTVGSDNSVITVPTVDRTKTNAEAYDLMREHSASNPNYEGLQGLVANFSYNLNTSNYWEGSLEIIAAAEAFSSSPANTYPCKECVNVHKDKDGNDRVVAKSTLYEYFHWLFKDFDAANRIYGTAISNTAAFDNQTIQQLQYKFNAAGRDENGSESVSLWEAMLPNFINQQDTTEPFVSWATIEAAVNTYSVVTCDGGQYAYGRYCSKGVILSGHYDATSSDPRVCILPGTLADTAGTAEPVAGGGLNCEATDQNGYKGILLENVLVNAAMCMLELKNIEEAEGKGGSINTFLLNVLAKINTACGDLWEFAIVNTTPETNKAFPVLTVVDTKQSPGRNVSTPYSIPSIPSNSLLRDMKLDMKLTDSMKTQALYSNVNNKNEPGLTAAGGGCGETAFKGFRIASLKNLALPNVADDSSKKCTECQQLNNEVNGGLTAPSLVELLTNLKEDVTDGTVSAVRSELIRKYGEFAKDPARDDHCRGQKIPFEFSCTLDGIGGFSFGQLITCDRIPPQIRESFDYQVTTVEHSVTINDWTTTLNTVCVYAQR